MAESNVTTMSPYFSCILKVGSGQYRSHFVCGVKSTLVVRGNGFDAVLSVPTSHYCGMTMYRYIVKLTPGFIHSPMFFPCISLPWLNFRFLFFPMDNNALTIKNIQSYTPHKRLPVGAGKYIWLGWCHLIYCKGFLWSATRMKLWTCTGQWSPLSGRWIDRICVFFLLFLCKKTRPCLGVPSQKYTFLWG